MRRLLRAAAPDPGAVLAQEEEDFAGMVEGKYRRYYSNDPLDLGEVAPAHTWLLLLYVIRAAAALSIDRCALRRAPGEALWLGHWGGSGAGWAQALSQRSALALEEMWQVRGTENRVL